MSKTVSPIKQSGIEYAFEWLRSGGVGHMSLSAKRISDGAAIWKTVIYEVQDSADVLLKSLSLVSTTLVAVNERGQMYKISATTGKHLTGA